MHDKYKLSSEFVIFQNCTMPKKKTATLIVMHDTTFNDHTTVSMWKFMNSGTENGFYGI